MKHDRYNIVWQKWADPLGEDDLEQSGLTEQSPITSDDIDAEFYDDDGNPIDSESPIDDSMTFYQKPTRVIMTPMGIIPYTDNTASNKIFNLWIGHTNFNLSVPIIKIIESFEGIETLDIFTRYRFRIGIGKLFNTAETMSALSDKIYNYLSDQE